MSCVSVEVVKFLYAVAARRRRWQGKTLFGWQPRTTRKDLVLGMFRVFRVFRGCLQMVVHLCAMLVHQRSCGFSREDTVRPTTTDYTEDTEGGGLGHAPCIPSLPWLASDGCAPVRDARPPALLRLSREDAVRPTTTDYTEDTVRPTTTDYTEGGGLGDVPCIPSLPWLASDGCAPVRDASPPALLQLSREDTVRPTTTDYTEDTEGGGLGHAPCIPSLPWLPLRSVVGMSSWDHRTMRSICTPG